MRKFFLFIIGLAFSFSLLAQEVNYQFTEASDLTITGKVFDTPNPYQRMDFERFGGWVEKDINLLQKNRKQLSPGL